MVKTSQYGAFQIWVWAKFVPAEFKLKLLLDSFPICFRLLPELTTPSGSGTKYEHFCLVSMPDYKRCLFSLLRFPPPSFSLILLISLLPHFSLSSSSTSILPLFLSLPSLSAHTRRGRFRPPSGAQPPSRKDL